MDHAEQAADRFRVGPRRRIFHPRFHRRSCRERGNLAFRKSIHQEANFRASRKRVYEALTSASQFDKMTHLGAAMGSGMALGTAPTEISTQAGGLFTIFAGHIVGRQVELVPNQRIVQAWRVVNWDPGLFSIARFELVEQGSGTRLVFDHTGFPKGQAEHLAAGWKGNYWEPLDKFLS
jgi:activator of HSP90 ATPase